MHAHGDTIELLEKSHSRQMRHTRFTARGLGGAAWPGVAGAKEATLGDVGGVHGGGALLLFSEDADDVNTGASLDVDVDAPLVQGAARGGWGGGMACVWRRGRG